MAATPQDRKAKNTNTKKKTPKPKAVPSTGERDYGAGWGGLTDLEDIQCPSGAWCQVRRPDPAEFLRTGLLDSADVITGVVANMTIPKAKGKGKPTVDVEKLLEDPKKLSDMLEMIDKIVLEVVVQPEIYPVPEANDEGKIVRVTGRIYVDRLTMEDKSFLTAWAVGEVGDFEEFRTAASEAVGDLSAVPVHEREAE